MTTTTTTTKPTAQQQAAQEARRAHYRHCRQALYWIAPGLRALRACATSRLAQESATLGSLTAYCLDRQD